MILNQRLRLFFFSQLFSENKSERERRRLSPCKPRPPSLPLPSRLIWNLSAAPAKKLFPSQPPECSSLLGWASSPPSLSRKFLHKRIPRWTGWLEANRSGPSRGFSRRCPVPIKPTTQLIGQLHRFSLISLFQPPMLLRFRSSAAVQGSSQCPSFLIVSSLCCW